MIDDFKKRLKEIADKVSNSQSAQRITTTQTPKISTSINTSISTNAKTTNKSGRTKSAPIIKEPKREKVSWSDDDSRDGWNDRLFLEGFYEVDGTVNDWEREKRMSQVEKSLKEIENRKQKAENHPGVIQSGGQRPKLNSNAARAPFGRDLTGQRGTFTRLPGNPNAPGQITKLPYYGSRYPAYTNYVNATNKNTSTASTSGDTTRPPTKEEMQAAYADMQKGFSGQNALQHINDAAEYVKSAATPASSSQSTTAPASKNQSRDEYDARVRENYRARQQSEADARYEDFDIQAAEERLRDDGYWIDRLFESRRQGDGFNEDEKVAAEYHALEDEIKRAKEAADRRRERYIREKVAQMPDNGLHELLRWSVRNMPETNQNTFSVNTQFQNALYPETLPGYSNGSIPQKNYYTKDKSIYGENTDEALDAISNILTATSLVPGIDTFADAAAIPVDLLRGDYISAGLDAFGVMPFVGEIADTAKLARAGISIADTAHDAGKVIDAVKTANTADDVADVIKAADDVYSTRKVDGTIKAFLDASDDPIAELTKMSGSIAKTSPIKVPEHIAPKIQFKQNGYYHMQYKWIGEDGYQYICRWHTRTPNAPLKRGDSWVVERRVPGVGYGSEHRTSTREIFVDGEWIKHYIWDEACKAWRNKTTTELQEEILKNGHWEV